MSKSLSKRLWSKGALAAATVTAAAVGITGLASAHASISNTGPGSYNSISGYGSSWHGQYGGSGHKVQNWSWQDNDWDRECGKWNPHHVKKTNYGHEHKKDYGHEYSKKKYDHKDKHDWKYADNHKQENKWDNGGYGSGWNDNHTYGNKHDSKDNYRHADGHNYAGHGGNNGYGGNGGYAAVTHVDYSNEVDYTVTNNNDITVNNTVHQNAQSGDASSSYNTHAGSVSTGNAYNESNNDFTVEVENNTQLPASSGNSWSAPEWGSVEHTGYHSYTSYEYSNQESYTVTNNNDVRINNTVRQTAESGDATSKYNTWGGHVTSGDAVNVSNNSFSVSIKNN